MAVRVAVSCNLGAHHSPLPLPPNKNQNPHAHTDRKTADAGQARPGASETLAKQEFL